MAGLDIQFNTLDGDDSTVVAQVSGVIDGSTVTEFQNTLTGASERGVKFLILDMNSVRYVNSTGLGALVKFRDVFRGVNGGLALIRVPPKVKIVIEMLGLHVFFEIAADVKSALASLKSGPKPEAPKPAERAPARPSPEPSRAPAPAQSAPSGGKPRFPVVADCQQCGTPLEFTGPGAYLCPRCYMLVTVSESGGQSFAAPEGAQPVQVSVPCTAEAAEGLSALVSVLATRLFGPGAKVDAIKRALHDVTSGLSSLVYKNDPRSIYHVLVSTNGRGMEIKISDYGQRLDPVRVNSYFASVRRVLDEFEIRPHPKGGNLFRLFKTR